MESEADEESQETKPAQEILEYRTYDANYDGISVSSPQQFSSRSGVKAKYYKQTYRSAWEHMPDFKGWLTGVQGEPTRAFCLYCQKTLHAHRLSLLKHTCTIRHQKAAQLHISRKGKAHMEPQITFIESHSSSIQEDLEGEDEGALVEYTTVEVEEQENDMDAEQEEGEEDEESGDAEITPNFPKNSRAQALLQMSSSVVQPKPPISTHVLDTARGNPVSGLQVSLYKLIEGRWTYINEGITNNDGRFANFIERDDFSPGRYKLHYDVDRYFELKKQKSMYPFIEIVFDCINLGDYYHVPLLLSPYGYTTYRGS